MLRAVLYRSHNRTKPAANQYVVLWVYSGFSEAMLREMLISYGAKCHLRSDEALYSMRGGCSWASSFLPPPADGDPRRVAPTTGPTGPSRRTRFSALSNSALDRPERWSIFPGNSINQCVVSRKVWEPGPFVASVRLLRGAVRRYPSPPPGATNPNDR